MSWLWGNETTEQAQFVVSALQSELDEREGKIKALEAALKREQLDMTSLLEDEVKELEARRKAIEGELAGVDALIREKQKLIQKSKSEALKKKKRRSGKKAKTPVSSPRAAVEEKPEAAAAAANGKPKEATLSPKAKKKQQKKKKAEASAAAASADAEPTGDSKAVLPMDKNLKMVAKEEPHVAFIIQRSNNSNTVVYAGCKSPDGKSLDPTTPIKVYWIMYEKEGNPREDLNMIERNTAYGVTSKPSDVPGEYLASIASLRDRDCFLRLDKHGNVMALTTINGKKGMLLRRVFVQMTTSWGIPTVDYVDIFGVDPNTFESVYEKKKNK
ncbi:hypothetical protein PHYPSEUDO_006638 [Phytophthora pseudosyringae]|uniref:DUF4833 domain-containing protein n=1 Tax=Phytophthora pseudosyringae TaxID=221518 RepID=A0A8T1WBU9_9STRA|nr:hypothetical protein PHYPSEUDO_006638 [Phytophthora pseudosyringae]